jgi:N-methylhydantoinase B
VLAGGAGWGDPLERDPGAVLKDVRNELLSPAKAAADYGVIIDTKRWAIDPAATKGRRAEIAARRGWREPPRVQRQDPLPLEPAAE